MERVGTLEEMIKPIKSIEWTPYRGERQEIIEVVKAKLNIYRDHVEIFCSFTYNPVGEEAPDATDFIRVHAIFRKSLLEIVRADDQLENDPEERVPAVRLYGIQNSFWLTTFTKDADEIFKALKEWILTP
jgi:hypothetical protein